MGEMTTRRVSLDAHRFVPLARFRCEDPPPYLLTNDSLWFLSHASDSSAVRCGWARRMSGIERETGEAGPGAARAWSEAMESRQKTARECGRRCMAVYQAWCRYSKSCARTVKQQEDSGEERGKGRMDAGIRGGYRCCAE